MEPQLRSVVRGAVGRLAEAETLLTPQELALLRQAFAKLDQDGDDWLSPEDLRRSMHADGICATKAEAETYVWEVDEDGDGRLAFPDFALLYARARRGVRRREPRKLSNYLIYRLIDLDCDGKLDTAQVYSYLCHIMDKDAANRNMNKIFGVCSDSPTTAEVTPAQWLTILETSLWEKDCPIVDDESAARHAKQNARFPLPPKDSLQSVRPRVYDRLDIKKLRETRKQVVAGVAPLRHEPYRGRCPRARNQKSPKPPANVTPGICSPGACENSSRRLHGGLATGIQRETTGLKQVKLQTGVR
ncbi:putative EF-hand domain-containing protein [Neospora caninum Liverpool]|uniref:EF-hand domain-containing protein, putative n=1 Tax=Neospora caninum (strain Liverpool) TaxID=572307 RepID=F0VDG0_NEOCL|nr:putative EF-hand domain-containing protein [Neospora caninum Liverpool]CBZ51753.1 putative EF-hand domain-containing protein [Neospora caninum Liverpool]CEL65708.1 TPA: EF-hand domain-containing protein, putative [Neospora caninum Liverpool]|eukprot:XP_003881786.1 putative EF-hand domain-containing protein [Neospora caninum Liverpool]